jgi:hypothetical protein
MREGVFVFSFFAVTQIVGTDLYFLHSFHVLFLSLQICIYSLLLICLISIRHLRTFYQSNPCFDTFHFV